MPGIQDIYSVNVSNRYALAEDTDEESDSAPDYDPLDTLKSLEDQKKRDLEEAKKKKQVLASKPRNQKKTTRFQENKDTNIPSKKEEPPKSAKPPRQQNDRNEGPPRANNRRPPREKQNYGEADENRKPPRRRNEPRSDAPANAKDEGTDKPKGDQSFGRPAGEFGPRRGERAERYRGGRGGFRNTGGNQGRGYGNGHRHDGRDDRGKREFDRRSGSDRSSVKPSDKRDGAGPRNWGTPGNEIDDAGEVTDPVGKWHESAETDEKVATEKEEKTEDENAEEKEPKPEEPSEMTLDEWKAQQEAAAKPSFNIRKAGEGEDLAKWENMKVLKKLHDDKMKQEALIEEQHKRQTKQQVNFNIQFGDNAPRGFGGRGRGRGGAGRGGAGRGGAGRGGAGRGGGGRGRGGRGGRFDGDRPQRQQLLPDVQNEQEFPTLG